MSRKKGILSRCLFLITRICGRAFAAVTGRKTKAGSGEIDHVQLFLAYRRRKKE